MTGQALDDWRGGWVLVELNGVVLDVDVVADAKELLTVLVGAGEQDGGHSDDVAHGQLAVVRGVTLHASKSKQTKSQWEPINVKSNPNLREPFLKDHGKSTLFLCLALMALRVDAC